MTGGLLNILAFGNRNIIVNGNPKKNFFTATYKKYTNFGLQKLIIDCNVTNRELRENDPSTFEFSISRWGDLILDTFFIIEMPHIWSPVFVEPSDIYDCPGGLRKLVTDDVKICDRRDPTIFSPTTCNDTTCTPENNPLLNACGSFQPIPPAPPPDTSGINCIPVSKIVSGLYNINDISGTANFFPRKNGWSQSPFIESFDFKWIDNLGTQLLQDVTLSTGGLIIQKFTGDYLANVVNRDFSQEKKDVFNEMTANIKKFNNPAFSGKRNGLYPNSLFGAPLTNTYYRSNYNTSTVTDKFLFPFLQQYRIYENIDDIVDRSYTLRANLNPSIFKRTLCIPLNFYYMFGSSQAFPLISLSYNELRVNIQCRPIRELFQVRDIRSWIDTYYHHNLAVKNITKNGAGTSIYEYYDPDYYINGGNFFSQKDIFKSQVRAPYISTINTVDPLYQMYMFTTQYPSQNQQYVRQAVFRSKESANVAADLRPSSIWEANPRLLCTYVYLDKEEQQVFRKRKQSYIIKQVQEYFFEKKNHKPYVVDRFTSNGIISNWMWYLQRSDVALRNEWSNYTNWAYSDFAPYALQPMYFTELSNNWYDPITGFVKTSEIPVWETKTFNTANPDIRPDIFPIVNGYITGATEPGNNRTNNYLKQVPVDLVSEFRWLPFLNDKGIFPGATSIWPGMNKLPPYFPYSFKKPDLDFNNPNRYSNGLNPYITGPFRKQNRRIISKTWGVKLDGKLREGTLESEYLNLVEPFLRSSGNTVTGQYVYNFGLNTDPFIIDPNGAINLMNYKFTDFEYTNIDSEQYDDILKVAIIPLCLPSSTNSATLPYNYNKVDWQIYEYSFNLKVMEEQYNYLTISDGLASLKFISAV